MPTIRQETEDEDVVWPPDDFSGEWIIEWPNGQVKYRALYLQGKCEGDCICYWANGNLAQDGRCLDGECVGLWCDYWEDGTKFKETEYHSKGNFDVRWLDSDGSLLETQEWRGGTKVIKANVPTHL